MKSDNSDINSYSAKFRRKRNEQLAKLITNKKLKEISILDIGGTKNFWEMNLKYFPEGIVSKIDIVNLEQPNETSLDFDNVSLRFYQGDGTDMSLFNKYDYDLVHSNSVIEHVGHLSLQRKFAKSIIKMGKFFWVQTPAKSFPLEPHFYVPYFAYLPLNLKSLLLRNFDLGFHKKENNWLESRIICEDTRLLTYNEFSNLFPKNRILKEKFLLFTKSYTATNLL